MRIILTGIAGPHMGRVFAFADHDTFLVGRSPQAHFHLPGLDEHLSRIHFLIDLAGTGCRLMDMNSSNGTYVNGQSVSEVALRDGDRIRAGCSVFRVLVENGKGELAPRVAPALSVPDASEKVETVPLIPLAPPRAPTRAPAESWPRIFVQSCPVCGSAVERPESTATVDEAIPCSHLFCPGCVGKIQKKEQPFPGYVILWPLGDNGSGTVYLALSQQIAGLVALKPLPANLTDQSQRARFQRETTIQTQLKHPHIVGYVTSGEGSQRPYLAREYVPGRTAADVLKQESQLSVSRAVGWICQLLDALTHAHGRRFVHRNLSTRNLLIVTVDGQEMVKLAGFSLVRRYGTDTLSGITDPGSIGGTLSFMPPEQITSFRDVTPAADQYAAAAVLYHLLTGKNVYDEPKELSRQVMRILHEEPVPIRTRRPDIPEALAAIIHRALAREPGDRHADVKAFRQALLTYRGNPLRCVGCTAEIGDLDDNLPESLPANLPPLCLPCLRELTGISQPIGGYVILRELGRGELGPVSLGLRIADATLVALKVMAKVAVASPRQIERFLVATEALRALKHPNIVEFRDAGEVEGHLYLATEYVQGGPLFELLEKTGAMSIPRAVGLICQLLEALEYAHGQNFVHCNLQPASVLVTQFEGRDVVKLAGFNQVSVDEATGMTDEGLVGMSFIGLAFIAPEQVVSYRDKIPASDQYASAALLYHLLTKQYVVDLPENLQQIWMKLLHEEPVPIRSRRKDIPAKLAEIIHRALAKDPGERFADVKALHQALLPFSS